MTYEQSTGKLRCDDGQLLGVGYSGAHPDGYNNPVMQAVRDVGPIPQGVWSIGLPICTCILPGPVDCPDCGCEKQHEHGPYVMRLTPVGHDAFGRTGFLIHGDSIEDPGYASLGCIVLPRATRDEIGPNEDKRLEVIGVFK